MGVDYISRKVLDRYFDRFTNKLVRINIRIMEVEAAWNRHTLLLVDLKREVDLQRKHLEEIDDFTSKRTA